MDFILFFLWMKKEIKILKLIIYIMLAWQMSVSCLMILQLLLADIIITFITSQHWKRKSSSLLQAQQTKRGAKEMCILKAVNYNSLFIFLLANIMTGLVNMAVTTHRIPDKMAIFILTSYMLSLCYISLILYNQNLSLKLSWLEQAIVIF